MEMKLVVIKGAKKTREVRLRSPEVVIGRQAGCGLRIPSATVSRRHCRLRLREGEVTIEDLKSANGTLLNGARVSGVEAVLPGDRLEIGPVMFLVEYQRADPAEMPPAAGPAVPPPLPLALPEAEPVPNGDLVEAIPLDDSPRKETVLTPGSAQTDERRAEEDVPLLFDEEDSWRLPAGQDLRDLLSQADEP
jgi:predicted component of type VI protein secretion system